MVSGVVELLSSGSSKRTKTTWSSKRCNRKLLSWCFAVSLRLLGGDPMCDHFLFKWTLLMKNSACSGNSPQPSDVARRVCAPPHQPPHPWIPSLRVRGQYKKARNEFYLHTIARAVGLNGQYVPSVWAVSFLYGKATVSFPLNSNSWVLDLGSILRQEVGSR